MATAHPLPAPGTGPGTAPQSDLRQPQAADQAMVPSPHPPEKEEVEFLEPSSQVARLPVELDVSIPVRDFRVRSLLALAPGHLIETKWVHGEDVPLAAGKVQLAWSEFEVIDTGLAVRITRLV